ncbi:MAG: glycosyltransferase [Candidatus Ratteibacteria bacterium]|nr:glycosyltransferase [Candidatus Ratteibacteria bacterium]
MKKTLKVVYLSTFPPRECGIAVFTSDLTNAMDSLLEPAVESRIAAVNIDDISRYNYSRKVIFQIDQYSQRSYIETAEKINAMDDVKLVNIQHEFGIFDGEHGSYIVDFLEALKKPSVVAFHSVLPSPDKGLYDVVRLIADKSNGLVPMTNSSKEILIRDYGIKEEKISVIPHGIHPIAYTPPAAHKLALGFAKKAVLLTFGFLSRGKGLEYVIDALPKVAGIYPDFVYVILGVTHPNILKQEGESYRNFLVQKVHELKLSSHVNFYNEYASIDKLLRFLKAADIYISPSLNPNQAVSGTLSYALGSGRPVISTAFAQAKELVTAEMGMLVNFKDPAAYADAIIKLLKEPVLREQLGKNAYFRTRNMMWENVALEYLKLFSRYSKSIAEVSEYKKIPRVNLSHMFRLTDDFGIIQFAKLSLPDVSSGYTLDDNARALIVACLCYGKLGEAIKITHLKKQKSELLKRIATYLNFMGFVLTPASESQAGSEAVFHNYVKPDRTIDIELGKKENPDDANGRAIWALSVAASSGYLSWDIRSKALVLLNKRITSGIKFESPRATAFCAKGIYLLLKRIREIEGRDLNPSRCGSSGAPVLLHPLRRAEDKMESRLIDEWQVKAEKILIILCDRLVSLYRGVSSAEWQWFENYLTYSNAVLPEALILGYKCTGNSDYFDIGIKTLGFLISHTFIDGIYMPTGQDGWHHRTGKRRYFDQQPEDTSAMTCALATAYSITGKDFYKKLMYEAFNWFLGDNSIKQVVYDRTTGGCYDGVGEGYINLNQGAESTTSYLLARLALIGKKGDR